MIKLIAHETNMKIPIYNSLHSDQKLNLNLNTKDIDLKLLNNLDLNYVDKKKFPSAKIIDLIPTNNSLFETILVSVNDSLVNLFLKILDIKKLLNIIRKKSSLNTKEYLQKH